MLKYTRTASDKYISLPTDQPTDLTWPDPQHYNTTDQNSARTNPIHSILHSEGGQMSPKYATEYGTWFRVVPDPTRVSNKLNVQLSLWSQTKFNK